LKKQNLGQFNTKNDVWLQPQIKEFIRHSGCVFGIDPFAGQGDLVRAANELGLKQVMGYDIDLEINKKYGWWWNDSLESIPSAGLGTILITNPPYLAKNSANRNDYDGYKYFTGNNYEDLYQLAIEKVIQKYKYSVLIIPETYFQNKIAEEHLVSYTVLEENPFVDTDCPVCVVCFDVRNDFMLMSQNEYKIYKKDEFLFTNFQLEDLLREFIPNKDCDITFNAPEGNLGLRAVDGTDPGDRIRFCRPEDLGYSLDDIKESSRAITVLDVPYKIDDKFFQVVNWYLETIRATTHDVIFAPFKNNNKNGERRRRLDYGWARKIINLTVEGLTNEKKVLYYD
jgi:hypothetical protein